jgi:hypothetical protein
MAIKNLFAVVSDGFFESLMTLKHFLVVAPALIGGSALHLSRHLSEYLH